MIRTLVGPRHGRAVDVGRRKQRHVLAADHAVLHAARQLIADLPGGHDGLRGQRPQRAMRRPMYERRQQRGLQGAVRQKSQGGVQHGAVEFDLQRQAAVRIIDGDRHLLRAELAQQPVQLLLKLRIGGGAIGRFLAARHDEIQGALAVERRFGADRLFRIGHAVQDHRARARRVAPHVELRHSRAVRAAVQIDLWIPQGLAHLVQIANRHAGGVEAHALPELGRHARVA